MPADTRWHNCSVLRRSIVSSALPIISESRMSCVCNEIKSKFMVLISTGPSVYVENNDVVRISVHDEVQIDLKAPNADEVVQLSSIVWSAYNILGGRWCFYRVTWLCITLLIIFSFISLRRCSVVEISTCWQERTTVSRQSGTTSSSWCLYSMVIWVLYLGARRHLSV